MDRSKNKKDVVPKKATPLLIPNQKKKYSDTVKILVINKLDYFKPKWVWLYKNVFTDSSYKLAFKKLRHQDTSCICSSIRPTAPDQVISTMLESKIHYQCKESCLKKLHSHFLVPSYPTFAQQKQELTRFVLQRVNIQNQIIYTLQTLHSYRKGTLLMEMKGQYVSHDQAILISNSMKCPLLIKTGTQQDTVSALYLDERASLAKFILQSSKLANVSLVKVQVFSKASGFLRVGVVASRDIAAGEVLFTRDSMKYD